MAALSTRHVQRKDNSVAGYTQCDMGAARFVNMVRRYASFFRLAMVKIVG